MFRCTMLSARSNIVLAEYRSNGQWKIREEVLCPPDRDVPECCRVGVSTYLTFIGVANKPYRPHF
jgi:hypothetical protein